MKPVADHKETGTTGMHYVLIKSFAYNFVVVFLSIIDTTKCYMCAMIM